MTQAQSLAKLEQRAINRTHITLVNGDTVQSFTTTLRQPRPKARRLYYWQGQNYILRTAGAYNGRLLHGPYRLTDRAEHLLRGGNFKKGVKTGKWCTWRPDGSLLSSSQWHRGQQRGKTLFFDDNSLPLAVASPVTSAAPVPHWWQLSHWRKPKAEPVQSKIVAPAQPMNSAVTPSAATKPRHKAVRQKGPAGPPVK